MSQSKRHSFYEALVNIVIGFSINFTANIFLIPIFVDDGHGNAAHLSFLANWWMGCAYTVISLIRSYAIRRFFTTYIDDGIERFIGLLDRAKAKFA